MARIIVTLDKNTISNLLHGNEVVIKPNVNHFDNLTAIVIKLEDYPDTDSMVDE